MLSKENFYAFLGYVEAAMADDERTADFLSTIFEIMVMLEEASQEDFYGSEGFEHRLGWDE